MWGLSTFVLAIWLLNLALELLLVILLFVHRTWRTYPAFFCYLFANLLQAGLLAVTYSHFGFASLLAKRVYWLSQIPIAALRAWVLVALWRQILVQYSGIWALAWRFFAVLAVVLLSLSAVFAGFDLHAVVLRADHAVSLTMVILLVALFVFARLYTVAVPQAVRSLSMGFILYLSFGVLNDTVLEHLLWRHSNLWIVLSMLSFLASVLLWVWAFRKPIEEPVTDFNLLPRETYRAFAPELNRRLRLLNERLSRVRAQQGDRP
jgi:hypothetical protein